MFVLRRQLWFKFVNITDFTPTNERLEILICEVTYKTTTSLIHVIMSLCEFV